MKWYYWVKIKSWWRLDAITWWSISSGCNACHVCFDFGTLKKNWVYFFPMETNQMFTMCNDFVHVINVDNLKCDLVLKCLLI